MFLEQFRLFNQFLTHHCESNYKWVITSVSEKISWNLKILWYSRWLQTRTYDLLPSSQISSQCLRFFWQLLPLQSIRYHCRIWKPWVLYMWRPFRWGRFVRVLSIEVLCSLEHAIFFDLFEVLEKCRQVTHAFVRPKSVWSNSSSEWLLIWSHHLNNLYYSTVVF